MGKIISIQEGTQRLSYSTLIENSSSPHCQEELQRRVSGEIEKIMDKERRRNKNRKKTRKKG